MSGQRRAKRKPRKSDPWYESAWLTGLLLLAIGVYLGIALWGPTVDWPGWLRGQRPERLLVPGHPGGPVGAVLDLCLNVAFGAWWSWTVPVLLVLAGIGTLANRTRFLRTLLMRLVPLWLASVAWMGQPGWPWGPQVSAWWAGAPGHYVGLGAHDLVGLWGARLFLSLALTATLVVALRPWPARLARALGPAARGLGRTLRALARGVVWLGGALWRGVAGLFTGRPAKTRKSAARARPASPRVDAEADADLWEEDDEIDEGAAAADAKPKERRLHLPEIPAAGADASPVPVAPSARGKSGENGRDQDLDWAPAPAPTGPVTLPDLELLHDVPAAALDIEPADLDARADLLEDTLRSFGVEGEVKDVRPGPVVTTFEYQPGPGVRVNQIVQRADDLALAMKARSLRMEAPIPGKAAVGIEIPNPQMQTVQLKEVLQATPDTSRQPLTITLGKDVNGQPVSIDLAAQPHLLVAGSTGSGKSVCLNAMISNLLLYNDPSHLRLLLIDPKMLELSVYNGIPHLLLPVVTDPREALRAIKWMVGQMDLRYRQLAKWSVRNIEQYNAKIALGEIVGPDEEPVTEPMPYYVTIVDELADLMVQLGQDLEIPITRLAQKARAVGLHLVLATQRPSVDVLTGVIKANIPCRIAFRVIQKNDSRTILDLNGAEQLLGRGDMLYLQPGRAQPLRVHGAFVTIEECEAVAAHWRQYAGVAEEISLTAGGTDGSTGVHTGDDDLFPDAVRVVVTHQSGSTSLLQRRLRVGYTRAGRLMDMMEEAGIVGPFTGSKARDVLVKPHDLPDLFGKDEAAE